MSLTGVEFILCISYIFIDDMTCYDYYSLGRIDSDSHKDWVKLGFICRSGSHSLLHISLCFVLAAH